MALRLTENLLKDIALFIDEHRAVGSFRLSHDSDGAVSEGVFEEAEGLCAPCFGAAARASAFESAPAGEGRGRRASGRLEDALAGSPSIGALLARKEETFSEALLREIDKRHLADPEVYKRANVDRKLFSKIRSNAQYRPKKPTAIALVLALAMNLDDTLDLIGRAGYTLTASSEADLIVMYFIERECWDVNLINQVLYKFDQPLIGC